jgi:hypothetical protein
MSLLRSLGLLALLPGPAAIFVSAQSAETVRSIQMPDYAVEIEAGNPPRLAIERNNEAIFEVPVVSGLGSDSQGEKLSDIKYSVHETGQDYELSATAGSTLWTGRRFVWHFFSDHIEFQQFATGSGRLGRAYFLSNGVSNRWDAGTTGGRDWDTTIWADHYFAQPQSCEPVRVQHRDAADARLRWR